MCVLENNQQGNQIVCFAYTMSKRDSYGKWIFVILLSLAQAEHKNGIQTQPTKTHPPPPETFSKDSSLSRVTNPETFPDDWVMGELNKDVTSSSFICQLAEFGKMYFIQVNLFAKCILLI